MGWEAIIANSTVNIRPTMTMTRDTQKPRYPRTKTHAQTRTEAPLPLTTPGRLSERKGSSRIAGKFFLDLEAAAVMRLGEISHPN
jgi:hypothetical protein